LTFDLENYFRIISIYAVTFEYFRFLCGDTLRSWSLWASGRRARRLAAGLPSGAGVGLVDECEEDRPPASFQFRIRLQSWSHLPA